MIQLSLCNELLAEDGLTLPEQCRIAAELGYMGIELAPGTVDPVPHEVPDDRWRAIRLAVENQGLRVTGLHWLLAPYPDLSVTDPSSSARAAEVLVRLVRIAETLGAEILVHGSPSSRQLPEGADPARTVDHVAEVLAPVAQAAEDAGLTYCIEPLSPAETPFVNTVEEALRLVRQVDSPAFRTMLDTCAAGQAEALPVADLIRKHAPRGELAHIQVNDSNRGAPGMGDDPFADIARALREVGWSRPVAVEPFRTLVNGTVTAAVGAATMRAAWSAAG